MRHKRRRLQRQRKQTALAMSRPWGTRGQENPRRSTLVVLRGVGQTRGQIRWVTGGGFGVAWPTGPKSYAKQDWDRFAEWA